MAQNKSILLIPHYNNPKGLINSLASVGIAECIDVVIIDDGSTSKLEEQECLSSFKANGDIHFLYIEKNQGIESAMNKGLDFIKKNHYKYIARLDCGDLNTQNRFKIQEEFLEKNTDILLVGSHSHYIDLTGDIVFTQRNPITPEDVRKRIFIACPFVHPTIMFSRNIFKYVKGYTTAYPYAEDYALYLELNKYGIKMANIDEILLSTEDNPEGISLSKRREQQQTKLKLIKDYFEYSIYPILGFVRTLIIYYTPYLLLLKIKKLLK